MSWCFFVKQKTAYEMRISDWSSDGCSSDLLFPRSNRGTYRRAHPIAQPQAAPGLCPGQGGELRAGRPAWVQPRQPNGRDRGNWPHWRGRDQYPSRVRMHALGLRSDEHTSELQSLMRISYAVFCLQKKNINIQK